ncbi:hypothetical protein SAMN05444920_114166 [Nonomuraea solani]|uniref:Integral membrane protein n=1 Tax=Nonomuraea solani TaxID=1144553 RepID=A0A1H6EPT9_9ACTN|nr:hypothetical protein [Nonomuraea solani]SEG99890.1 hypothetical protein SAMN05444920_114166 [Nonomuraea solani]
MPSGMASRPDALSGVTELRLHGVGGTSPQALLDDLTPMRVSGDRIAGFYRTADQDGRHVEAYSWGGLTSGSSWRVLWLLLLPFALANMAARMFPAWLPDRPVRFRLFRWAARLASFALTLNLVMLAAVIPIDYVAYQCGGVEACARWWPLSELPQDRPAVRILAGAVVPLLVIAILYVLAYTSQNRYDQVKPAGPEEGKERPEVDRRTFRGLSDPAFWNDVDYTRTLTRLHVAGSVALVAALVGWTAHSVSPVAVPWLVLALPVAVATGCVPALAADTASRRLSWALLGLAGVAMVIAAVVAVTRPQPDPAITGPHELPGVQVFMDGVYGIVFTTLFLILATLVAAAWTRPNRLRLLLRALLVTGALTAGILLLSAWETGSPWIWIGTGLGIVVGALGVVSARPDGGGTFRWAAPFVVHGLAVAALNTFMLATLLGVADLLGDVRPCHGPVGGLCAAEPHGPVPIAVFPMIGDATPYLIVVPLLLVLAFTVYQGLRWWISGARGERAVRDEYRLREAAHAMDPEWWVSTVAGGERPAWQKRLIGGWPRRVARARRLAHVPRDLDLLLTALVVVGLVLFAWIQSRIWSRSPLPVNSDRLTTVSSFVAALLPVVLLGLLWRGWRHEENRRMIGVLWDVATFWPRHSHPLAPPSYAERAVPDLQRRLWWLHDNGGLPLVAAHSQGSVIAVAALAQPRSRPEGDHVTLVTFGAPLRTLYAWGFPAYFDDALFDRLAHGPDIKVARWRNFWCDTDYIGGPVSVRGDVDHRLPDPPTSRFLYGQPLPKVGAHTGYWDDAELGRHITLLAHRSAEERNVLSL